MSIHTIHFSAGINPVSLGNFQSIVIQALAKKATEIQIYMSSPGGSTSSGLAMYGLLRSLPISISMFNIGNIESMACLVFLAADQRKALSTSRFLFHPMAWNFTEATNASYAKLKEMVSTLDNDVDRYTDIFAMRTVDATERLDVRNCLTTDATVITPSDALRYGIISEVSAFVVPDVGENRWWISD